jgi:hypothetical protein
LTIAAQRFHVSILVGALGREAQHFKHKPAIDRLHFARRLTVLERSAHLLGEQPNDGAPSPFELGEDERARLSLGFVRLPVAARGCGFGSALSQPLPGLANGP